MEGDNRMSIDFGLANYKTQLLAKRLRRILINNVKKSNLSMFYTKSRTMSIKTKKCVQKHKYKFSQIPKKLLRLTLIDIYNTLNFRFKDLFEQKLQKAAHGARF
jgi:hypothetical protein